MTKTISFINHKGGVGKTTVTAHLAYALVHQHGKNVLCIDFDTQANLSDVCGIREPERTVADFLDGEAATSVILHVDGLHIIPSSMELANMEYTLTANNTQNAFKMALEPIAHLYDYVLIDCPPSLGLLTVNALIASTDVCVVTNAEWLALKGLANIITVVKQVQLFNQRLALSSVIVSHYDSRKAINREVFQQLQDTFAERVLLPPIRSAVAVVEASSHGGTVFQIRPNADVVNDFSALTSSFLQHYE